MLKASDIMTQDVVTICGSVTVADAVKLIMTVLEITAFEEFCQQYPEVLALRHQQLVGV